MNDKGPHLVICPASLLENWERELQRWCPALNVVSYYGSQRSEIRYNLEMLRYVPTPPVPTLTLHSKAPVSDAAFDEMFPAL